MQHYCRIDLHSNNHVVVVIDEEDKHVFEKRLGNVQSMANKGYNPLVSIQIAWRVALMKYGASSYIF